jgi:hypothetical protein
MPLPARRAAILAAVFGLGLMCQGCLSAAVGVTGAVVGGTVHAAGAVGSAIVPGESKKQRAKRLDREDRARQKAAKDARRR